MFTEVRKISKSAVHIKAIRRMKGVGIRPPIRNKYWAEFGTCVAAGKRDYERYKNVESAFKTFSKHEVVVLSDVVKN